MEMGRRELAFDVELLSEAEPAMALDAHVSRIPRRMLEKTPQRNWFQNFSGTHFQI